MTPAPETAIKQTALQIAIRQIGEAELVGARQEDYRQQIMDFCSEHSDALFRTCLSGHLTGSAAVVDPSRSAALILHHVKLDRWLQPGGHADGDGDLSAVALREASEETGLYGLTVHQPAIDLDIHEIPARPGEPAHLHLDVRFLVIAQPGSEPVGNHESHALDWWRPGSAIAQPDESTRRLLRRALAVVAGAYY